MIMPSKANPMSSKQSETGGFNEESLREQNFITVTRTLSKVPETVLLIFSSSGCTLYQYQQAPVLDGVRISFIFTAQFHFVPMVYNYQTQLCSWIIYSTRRHDQSWSSIVAIHRQYKENFDGNCRQTPTNFPSCIQPVGLKRPR